MFDTLLDPRLRVLVVSLASLVVSLTMLLAGTMLVSRSRHVSENIGYRVYQLYGEGLLQGIRNILPDVPGVEEVLKELDIVIHDVLISDIGDTLDNTVVIAGIVIIILASLQIVANSILLGGSWTRRKNLVPSILVTRIFFLSTFWGIIDSFRETLAADDLGVILV